MNISILSPLFFPLSLIAFPNLVSLNFSFSNFLLIFFCCCNAVILANLIYLRSALKFTVFFNMLHGKIDDNFNIFNPPPTCLSVPSAWMSVLTWRRYGSRRQTAVQTDEKLLFARTDKF